MIIICNEKISTEQNHQHDTGKNKCPLYTYCAVSPFTTHCPCVYVTFLCVTLKMCMMISLGKLRYFINKCFSDSFYWVEIPEHSRFGEQLLRDSSRVTELVEGWAGRILDFREGGLRYSPL